MPRPTTKFRDKQPSSIPAVTPAATGASLRIACPAEANGVFGFILVGGTLVGAQVRDIRLANELVRRGYPVHVWWAFDWPRNAGLDPAIEQRWLFSSSRYSGFMGTRLANDAVGHLARNLLSDGARNWIVQNYPDFMGKQMRAIIQLACAGVDGDRPLIRRFAAELSQRKVTHLLPNLEMLSLFAEAARPHVTHPMKYLVTFQGYEVYGNFAHAMGCEEAFYARLADTVARSDWPAVAVSEAYRQRIHREVRVPLEQLAVIPPGVPVHERMEPDRACRLVSAIFPQYRADLPLISYVGRRDSEKGLDLLLYAAKMLECRGVPCQLAICGPTAFGKSYEQACAQIAQHLRVPVLSTGYVSNDVRAALFRISRTVVYPSIHEEPFGMVPVEAMAQGTPVVVPDVGGVAGVTQMGSHRAGLQFACWDTRALADQLQALIEQPVLHAALSTAAPRIADHFSVARLGERILDHVGLPHWCGAAERLATIPTTDPAVAFRRAA
jgi:glycosyltransferase involved in cell wall biosynthesis